MQELLRTLHRKRKEIIKMPNDVIQQLVDLVSPTDESTNVCYQPTTEEHGFN